MRYEGEGNTCLIMWSNWEILLGQQNWYSDISLWTYVMGVLDQHADLDLYSASKQQSVGRHVAPLGHIILTPSQPVFAFTP